MWLKLTLVALGLLALGPAVARTGGLPPLVCFGASALGLLVGLLALPAAVVAYRKKNAPGHALLVTAAFWLLLAAGVFSARGVPRINDITTSPEDPPAFQAALAAASNRGRDLRYPPANAALQRQAYADLAPLSVDLAPAQALERARKVAEQLGWQVVEVAPEHGRLEATQQSGAFRFVDDIVVRVRPEAAGARVDVRSKSRDGKSDLGKNAQRIRVFMAAMER